MSGREQVAETEKNSCAGDHKKSEVQGFHTCSIDRRGIDRGGDNQDACGSKGEVVQSSGTYGGRGFAVPCAGK